MADVTSTQHLSEKIKRYLEYRNLSALKRLLARQNFADIAEIMENTLSDEERVALFQFLDMGQASNVLSSLSLENQIACLNSFPVLKIRDILRVMPADDAVDILQEMESDQIKKILHEMPFDPETRTLHHLMLEAPDTAAGVMSTEFLQINVNATVGEALELVRRAEEKYFVYYVYLLDDQQELVGVVSLKQLIQHTPETTLRDLGHFDIKTIPADTDQEAAANLFRKYYNLLAMPVVDNENKLKGIITLDDIVDIIDEETSEDMYLASGIDIEKIDEKNLLTGPMINAVKARMPWLLVTLFGQLFAATILATYQNVIASAAIAVTFMPLLSGLSGNMGTQSETIAVRGLALNLITHENIRKKLWREVRVSTVIGVTFGFCVGILTLAMHHNVLLSSLLFGAIILSLISSACLGLLIPYGYQRVFKQDPAGVGGPLLTTLLDILTFTAYINVVSLFLKQMQGTP